MEKIRLQKFIADAGLMSRRAAEAEIEAGNFAVNGHPAEIGAKVDPREDLVTYKGKRIKYEKREHTYIMLNKPRGYLSATSDDRGRKCVTDLLDEVKARVYPVGRLDMISEGMLLLTDDGELKNRLTHPKHTVPKVYRVKVGEAVGDREYGILTSALEIDGYVIKPVEVAIGAEDESGTVLKMTLYEGRNRQIRKMCEAAGLTVKRLSRVSIGNLKLDGLPVGKWRYLEDDEVEYLYKATKGVKMFKIFPIQDKARQNELCIESGITYREDAFAYLMIDVDSGAPMGISQFEILGDEGYIFDLCHFPSVEDDEAMFILGRQTMNFIDLCGAHICRAAEYAADKTLLHAIGFRLTDGEWRVDMNGMFDGNCGNH